MITYKKPIDLIEPENFYTATDQITHEIFYRGTSRFVTKTTNLRVRTISLTNPNAKLTKTDKLVYEAIYSLYRAGNEYFTLKMLKKFMAGTKTATTDETFAKLVSESIGRLNDTEISIDFSDASDRAKKILELGGSTLEGTLLATIPTTFEAYGKELTGWKIIGSEKSSMTLMYFAREMHMMVKHTPAFMYGFHKEEHILDTLEVLKDRMITCTMTNFKGATITFTKIMEDVDYAITSSEEAKTTTRLITNILRKWNENGTVKGYRVNSQHGKRYSVTFNN